MTDGFNDIRVLLLYRDTYQYDREDGRSKYISVIIMEIMDLDRSKARNYEPLVGPLDMKLLIDVCRRG